MTDQQLISFLNDRISQNSTEIQRVRLELQDKIEKSHTEVMERLGDINKNLSSLDRDRVRIKAFRSFVLWVGGAVITAVAFANNAYTAAVNFFINP